MTDEVQSVANKILDVSRNRLFVNLRFLDMALSFHNRHAYTGSISTDGSTIYFDPMYVINMFKRSQEEMARTYLHIIIHCIFMHPFIGPGIDRNYWDIACDIAVENTINEFEIKSLQSARERQQLLIINEIKKTQNYLTAEKVYYWLKNSNYPQSSIDRWKTIFSNDDHDLWYMWNIALSGNDDTTEDNLLDPSFVSKSEGDRLQTEDFWKKMASRVQVDFETYSKSRGNQAGSMIQNLKSVNREKYDYSEFLKKFAVLGEAMTVNEDEFDYIYYTYGLKHYSNMPLIEPLEYKEVRRIRDFVIAIDTSGSVMGDEVQMFLQKTYNILMQENSFFSRINLHIIQCDAVVQNDYVITNRKEFEEYLKTMEIIGLGGTDFRPVFAYVDKLIEEKKFTNLKGLIYFTDGHGVFPERPPTYVTAFVFVEEGYEIPEVPPWAIRLVLQHEDIIEGGVQLT